MGWSDWLMTPPPPQQGGYTVSAERGAVLDTPVLLLEHMYVQPYALVKYFGFSELTSQDKP